ncbi:MAG: HDOD domain-containing protein [Betaproteobacteria bacterium]|nr:HDOD domain-containing protein [Betaproteobacteria bacterium]
MTFRVVPEDAQAWVAALGEFELPVLDRTLEELASLREIEERVTARDIARVLVHDPMFAVRVLRYLQTLRVPGESSEITTVEHALMMLGVGRFFRVFVGMHPVSAALRDYPEAYKGLMQVVSRAFHAAMYARDWAVQRHDIEADEVTVAALLHDLAEMLLWCFAPGTALRIQRELEARPGARSGAVQREVLGFRLIDLQLALVAEWKLPALLRALMDDAHAAQPRVLNVVLAVNLARHSAQGWSDPALPDDYASIQRLLGVRFQEALEGVYQVARQAARSRDWYGVVPPADWL